CLALAGCLKTPGKGPWSKATGAEEHERLMWQAIHDKKWNEVENHIAATFTATDTHGLLRLRGAGPALPPCAGAAAGPDHRRGGRPRSRRGAALRPAGRR